MKRNEDTCISVDIQYRERSRSSTSKAEPGRIRSPRIAFALASKSGHSTGAFFGGSGTTRPMTRSRSFNSTVFPAFSQAFSRRVSRSCRMFMVGMVINVTQNVSHGQPISRSAVLHPRVKRNFRLAHEKAHNSLGPIHDRTHPTYCGTRDRQGPRCRGLYRRNQWRPLALSARWQRPGAAGVARLHGLLVFLAFCDPRFGRALLGLRGGPPELRIFPA